jgi:arylsulfatase A-like enzyme
MQTRPDIVIFIADQQRADALGVAGNPDIRTPNIDALAAEGVSFSSTFCPYPVCTPSRYSLFSGLYVHQHGGWDNHCTLGGDLPSFPRILREAGYRTGAVGKMHFTPTYLDIGLDDMVLSEQNGPGRYEDDYHRYLYDRDLIDYVDSIDQIKELRKEAHEAYWKSLGATPSILPEEHSSSRWIADRAIEQIDRWGDEPNLLVAGFVKPHHPFDPPEPWASMYDPDALHLVPGYRDTPDERDLDYHGGFFPHGSWSEDALRRAMAGYYASISQIDHEVGRIVEKLKAKGRYDNTLIVYLSDHGEYLGFRHLLLKGGQLYDPLMRVPLIVRPPRTAAGGSVAADAAAEGADRAGVPGRATHDGRLASLIDVAPTILNVVGEAVPEEMTGIDLFSNRRRECLFSEARFGNAYMARTNDRKLVVQESDDQSRFFDLATDPLESDDLYHEPSRRAEIAELRERLMRWRLFDSPPPTRLVPTAPQTEYRWAGAPSVPASEIRAYIARRVREIAEE